jgi:hypothetical protein
VLAAESLKSRNVQRTLLQRRHLTGASSLRRSGYTAAAEPHAWQADSAASSNAFKAHILWYAFQPTLSDEPGSEINDTGNRPTAVFAARLERAIARSGIFRDAARREGAGGITSAKRQPATSRRGPNAINFILTELQSYLKRGVDVRGG